MSQEEKRTPPARGLLGALPVMVVLARNFQDNDTTCMLDRCCSTYLLNLAARCGAEQYYAAALVVVASSYDADALSVCPWIGVGSSFYYCFGRRSRPVDKSRAGLADCLEPLNHALGAVVASGHISICAIDQLKPVPTLALHACNSWYYLEGWHV